MLGAGNVGWNAAWIAQGMEAEVLLLDKNLDRLRWVDQIHKGRIMTLASNRGPVERAVADADLVIGAVLVPGGRAPVVVTEAMVRTMKPGVGDRRLRRSTRAAASRRSTRPRTPNPCTSCTACSTTPSATCPRRCRTRRRTRSRTPRCRTRSSSRRTGVADAVAADDRRSRVGVNTVAGNVTNAAVAEALGRPITPLADALSA